MMEYLYKSKLFKIKPNSKAMKEIKNEDKGNASKGPGKGKDRQKAVTIRLNKIGLSKKNN